MITAIPTRAQLRDMIRRRLEIQAPIDYGLGASGDAPAINPDPSNPVINDAITEAISTVNRLVRLVNVSQVLTVSQAAPAATWRGPFYVDYSAQIGDPGSIVEIEHVWWTTAASDIIKLQPYSYYAKGRGYEPLKQEAPGRPIQYVVAGSQIGILPAPNTNGSLSFTYLKGMPYLMADSSQLTGVPLEIVWPVVYWACYFLCAQKAYNVDYQARGQNYLQLAKEATLQAYAWKRGFEAEGLDAIRKTLNMFPAALEQAGSSNANNS